MTTIHVHTELFKNYFCLVTVKESSVPEPDPQLFDFTRIKEDTLIGKGSYGAVYKYDATRAVKVIRTGGLHINHKAAIKEIEIMGRL
jgi:hypothetical protein